jgi:hypothetical protein
VVAAGLAALALAPGAPGLAVTPQEHWGFAVGLHPNTASYQPGPLSSRDDKNTTVTISHFGTGYYHVEFPGLQPVAENDGTFFATAISNSGATCSAGSMNIFPSKLDIDVHCYDRTGVPAETRFSANYLDLRAQTGAAAYFFAGQPSAPSYTPSGANSFNSTGGTNSITRSGPGWYDALLQGLNGPGGHAQVTAASPGASCEVASMTAFNTGFEGVRVYCRNSAGAKADATFTLVFTRDQGLKRATSQGVAYLVANHPAANKYVPAAGGSFQSNGGTPVIRRGSAGRYTATLSGMQAGGAAQVTTYGTGTARCELSALPTTGTPVTIGVVCVKPDGTPSDTRFGLEYTR